MELYIALVEINSHQIAEKMNKKVDISSVYVNEGFEFQVLYQDDSFFQIKVYAENVYTTQILGASIENCGIRIGGKYNVPILVSTYGGFAGILCSYVFMMSNRCIEWDYFYQSLGIDSHWIISPENYQMLEKRLSFYERTTGFLELEHYIETERSIYEQTERMVSRTKVYGESFQSSHNPNMLGKVKFKESLTLIAAREAVIHGKHTAVLNFANPVEPGGGVLRGASAQEESICRVSNLYNSLISEKASSYYQANKQVVSKNQYNSMFLGTDKVIFTPDVLILKENTGYREGFVCHEKEQYTEEIFNVDVITCAAPFFSGSGYIIPNGDLQHLLERRIRNILEVAIENEVEVIILGALGCGAFHNPPVVVADAFREVLLESRYKNAFDEVIFAVKRTEIICENIEAFQKNFSIFPELNYQGSEKQHKDHWKWECDCGLEHSWTEIQCSQCKTTRKKAKIVRML